LPISKDIFSDGKPISPWTPEILGFLDRHADSAYSKEEILAALGIPDLPENRLVLRIILEALMVQKKIIGTLVINPERKIEYFAAHTMQKLNVS